MIKFDTFDLLYNTWISNKREDCNLSNENEFGFIFISMALDGIKDGEISK